MIIFKTTKKIAPKRLYDVYESVNWTKGVKDTAKHGKLLAKVYASSDGVFSAWDGKELVGVIRFITDKYAHGMIYGLAVRPEYAGKGIATHLVERCTNKFPKIQWSAELEGSPELYKKLGFQKSLNDLYNKGECPV